MEDKQAICDALVQTLNLTRNQDDLLSLEYHDLSEDRSEVVATWANGAKQHINTTLDSGTAMIRDIVTNID